MPDDRHTLDLLRKIAKDELKALGLANTPANRSLLVRRAMEAGEGSSPRLLAMRRIIFGEDQK